LTMLGAAPSVARGSLVSVAPARSRSELLTADPAKPTVTGARHGLRSQTAVVPCALACGTTMTPMSSREVTADRVTRLMTPNELRAARPRRDHVVTRFSEVLSTRVWLPCGSSVLSHS
jgi:hypothetical protein